MATSLIIPGVQLMDATGVPVSIGGDPTVAPKLDALNSKFPTSLGAQPLSSSLSVTPVTPDTLGVLSQANVAITTAAASLTGLSTARYGLLQVFTPIYFTLNGTVPTTAAPGSSNPVLYLGGSATAPGQYEFFSAADLAAFKFISVSGTGTGTLLLRG